MRLPIRSEEHTSELQSHDNLVCRLLLEKNRKQSEAEQNHDRYFMVGWRQETCFFGKHEVHHDLGFFFNDPATTEIHTLSLHDALPICLSSPLLFSLVPRCQGAGASQKKMSTP